MATEFGIDKCKSFHSYHRYKMAASSRISLGIDICELFDNKGSEIDSDSDEGKNKAYICFFFICL